MPWLMLYFAFAFPVTLFLAVLILEQWQQHQEQQSALTDCPQEGEKTGTGCVTVGGGPPEPSATAEDIVVGGRHGGRLTIQGFG